MEKLQEVQERLAQLDPNNRDHLAEIQGLKTQEAELIKQVKTEEELAVLEKNHEERVQTAKDEFATYIHESLTEDGLTPEEIFIGDTQRHLYTIKCSQAFNALVSRMSAQINGSEEREIQLRRQNDDLQDKLEAAAAQLRLVTSELKDANSKAATFEFHLEEMTKSRDNAATQLEEERKETERLNSQVDDLRQEIAVGARNAYKVVDAETQKQQIEDLVKQIKESRIKVTNIRWEDDLKKTFKLAELAETGETIRFHYFEQGKYLELNPQEVLQFRLEQAQNSLPDQPLVQPDEVLPPEIQDVTQGQFREGAGNMEDTAASAEDAAGDMGQPVGGRYDQSVLVAEVATLKQTVDTLTADVEALKRKVG